ncbi:MAG: DUF2924 domain-containing protein [Thermomicrobiales bacterium]
MTQLDDRLEELRRACSSALRQHWCTVFRSTAPDMPPDLMRRAIAWRLQEGAHGGLASSTMKAITALQASLARDGGAQALAPALKSGTRLVREWHGRTHHVLICDEGYEYEQRRYRSLSQIAREITGAAWSGPRFFGLKPDKRNGTQG